MAEQGKHSPAAQQLCNWLSHQNLDMVHLSKCLRLHALGWCLLSGLLMLTVANCRSASVASDPTGATRGDSLLETLFVIYWGPDDFVSYHAWYHAEDPEAAHKLAVEAEADLRKTLGDLQPGSPEAIACLRKLALAAHFQCGGFDYQKSLPADYRRALDYIEQAIAAQQKLPPSTVLGDLYVCAGRIAKPHFYFGFTSELASAAEQRGQAYLDQAIATYAQIGADSLQLRAMRIRGVRDLGRKLEIVALGRKVEGDTSLALATDIALLVNQVAYPDSASVPRELVDQYIQLADTIFEAHALDELQRDTQHMLLADAARYYRYQCRLPDKALEYYRKVQALELAHGRDTYANAFQMAGMHLEQQAYAAAAAQYDLALKSTRLAVIDVEHAYFGKAMVAQLQGKDAEAIAMWRGHLTDQEIMNGISSYQGDFTPAFWGHVRAAALELIDAVAARNARRIVEEGWGM